MRTIGILLRITFRTVKWIVALYALWDTLMASRWLALFIALYRLFRRKPRRNVATVANFRVANGGEPAIYERRGWRKLSVRRRY